ncbi:hypothetical protein HZH68_008328 [Vespula germanica]|uniref:Uncharacterized protein n=1 Tax=Vespula germanica TaxID=30212 RepID=A0A834K9E4_VESGE|nr:hypothetical protein HZH68_008328 [Vespula germanica]
MRTDLLFVRSKIDERVRFTHFPWKKEVEGEEKEEEEEGEGEEEEEEEEEEDGRERRKLDPSLAPLEWRQTSGLS